MIKAPYFLYGQTTSLCEFCSALVPTKIIFEGQNVFYIKYCATHSYQRTLVSTDIEYYKQCRENYSPSYKPEKIQTVSEKYCPLNCGLCTEHEQYTAAAILEILEECNMNCPICIAGSHTGAGKFKSLEEIETMLNVLIQYEKHPNLVMVSGGEPTIHPDIIEILKLVKAKGVKHVMLITNGVRISNDLEFVDQLKKIKDNLEVYLQFDSLNSEVLKDLRGEDLVDIRINAVKNLESAEIHSTLVCVVKKGLNEHEVNDVIEFALKFKFVRGVTFQPCKMIEKNKNFEKEKDYITLSEVRKNLLQNSIFFSKEDLIPHPLNPENICIGYLKKSKYSVDAVTSFLYPSTYRRALKEDFAFSQNLESRMFFTPDLNSSNYKYEDLFRVAIVSYMDKFNFCTSSVKKSFIHVITNKGEIIPLETYYIFYQSNEMQEIK